MIDTMALESPSISEEIVLDVECFLNKYYGIEVQTGLIKYEFTSGQLAGSYDSKISIQVKRERFFSRYEWDSYHSKAKHCLVTEPSEPYLVVECSVHKAILGHNVFGGSSDFIALSCWLVNFLEKTIKIDLPYFEVWSVRRIDIAEIFDLGSYEAVEEYIRGLKHAYYPRRAVVAYKFESVYVSGAKTTLKLYHKGPEFAKHDRSRLQRVGLAKKIDNLQTIANKILRVEVEVKSKKLREIFDGRLPFVGEITTRFLQDCYNKEVFKLLKERQEPDQVEIYRTTESVLARLTDLYPTKLSRNLYGTWIKLASLGEDRVKELMSKPTFYKHRKLLQDSNVSWLQSDLLVIEKYSSVPPGFMPVMSDLHRCLGVDEFMLEELRRVAA